MSGAVLTVLVEVVVVVVVVLVVVAVLAAEPQPGDEVGGDAVATRAMEVRFCFMSAYPLGSDAKCSAHA